MGTANDATLKNVEQLNNLLEGEIAAVETYRIALDKLEAGSDLRQPLDACFRSHSQRVTLLQQRISALGGVPSDTSGTWGAVARTAETVSAAMGDTSAVATLESGEDHGLKCYKIDYDKMSAETLNVVTNDLLPRQEETHRLMSNLKKQQKLSDA